MMKRPYINIYRQAEHGRNSNFFCIDQLEFVYQAAKPWCRGGGDSNARMLLVGASASLFALIYNV